MLLDTDPFDSTTISFTNEAPAPPERRTDRRHLTILRVAKMITERSEDLCLIRNISAGGLMAHVYRPIQIDQKVTIEMKSGQLLTGQVRWVQDSNVGIQFDDRVNVGEVLSNAPPEPGAPRPRAPRVDMSCRARLRAGATFHKVNVRDISQGGVKIEISGFVLPEDQVVIQLEHFRPMPGVVRWAHHGMAGIAFHEVIPYPELTQWLKDHCD